MLLLEEQHLAVKTARSSTATPCGIKEQWIDKVDWFLKLEMDGKTDLRAI